MDMTEKAKELIRIGDLAGEMPIDKFHTKCILSLALAVTENDDEKYKRFIQILESSITSK